jgi:hypothetical protein
MTDHTEVKPGERCVVSNSSVSGNAGWYVGPNPRLAGYGYVAFDGAGSALSVLLACILPEPKPLIRPEFTDEEANELLRVVLTYDTGARVWPVVLFTAYCKIKDAMRGLQKASGASEKGVPAPPTGAM